MEELPIEKEWLYHHEKSEKLASEAEVLFRKGKHQEAKELYGKAADEEWEATLSVPANLERTFSILWVSAAHLFVKAGRVKDAAFIAKEGIRKETNISKRLFGERELLPSAKMALEEILRSLQKGIPE